MEQNEETFLFIIEETEKSPESNKLNPDNPEINYNKEDSSNKAVWSKNATIAMLSLYEAKQHLLSDYGKKSKIWEIISEGLNDLKIQMTPNQIKWKFNRLLSKYKECVDNNKKSGRAPMTFEFFPQFDTIFNKNKDISIQSTIASSIIPKNKCEKKIEENKDEPENKKLKFDGPSTSSSPEKCEKGKKKVKRSIQTESLTLLQNIQNSKISRDEKLSKFLKNKEKDMEIKKKAIEVREMEIKIKQKASSDKLKFNEKKHKDWMKMETKKYKILQKLLKNGTDSEESDE